jgi:hypothetical protein
MSEISAFLLAMASAMVLLAIWGYINILKFKLKQSEEKVEFYKRLSKI